MAMRRVVAGENLITSRGLTFLVAGAKFARPSADLTNSLRALNKYG
ncbi:hypothetical protein M622_06080 [Thauera terpenica 58Eu]|jgi:hypothetical protein|uniref:Uncharacterized protein n=1 Tax=Thauera terpenica 58Eu TaxID=1348657 RepID=T0AP03_9RHOO|nr:hypothetical protein M622_06080 [Thauera terpenica 58Eu]